MLESIVNGGKAKQRMEELHGLIDIARQERASLATMFEQFQQQGGKVTEMTTGLEQVRQQTRDASDRLDVIVSRIAGIYDRVVGLELVEKQMHAVVEEARQATALTTALSGPDGQIQKQQELVERLQRESAEMRAGLEALEAQRATLEATRAEMEEANAGAEEATTRARALHDETESLARTVATLAREQAAFQAASATAREDSATVLAAADRVQSALAAFHEIQTLAGSTEDRLKALNALAEHVGVKTKALEAQKSVVEHAVSEASRLNEMVWAMESQIRKLDEGGRRAAETAETVRRIEDLSEAARIQVEEVTRQRDAFTHEFGRLETDVEARVRELRTHLDRLEVENRGLKAHAGRVERLQAVLADAEGRMERLTARTDHLAALGAQQEELTAAFRELSARFDELVRQGADVGVLAQRLADVDALAKETEARHTQLLAHREELQTAWSSIGEFYAAHAAAVDLCERLSIERRGLEHSGERIAAFAQQIPGVERRVDTLVAHLGEVERGAQQAADLGDLVARLEAGVSRVTERAHFVDQLERRLDGLHAVSLQVRQQLDDQLAQRAHLEALAARCEDLSASIGDAQQKLESIHQTQQQLPALRDRVAALAAEVERTQAGLDRVLRTDTEIAAQEGRLAEMLTAAREQHEAMTERTQQIRALIDQLDRAVHVRNELLQELSHVEARRAELAVHLTATEDQLTRADTCARALDVQCAHLSAVEEKIVAFERRVADLTHQAAGTDAKMAALVQRDAEVAAAREEVDGVRQIAARAKADVVYLSERQNDLDRLKGRLDELAGKVTATDEQIALVEARRRIVHDVHADAERIVHLLEDVRVNLDAVSAQKLLVEQVAEQVGRLEFSIQQAQNSARALQQERERAERVEQALRPARGSHAAQKQAS